MALCSASARAYTRPRCAGEGAKLIRPSSPAKFPHARVDLVGIERVDLDIGAAGAAVDIQDLLPGDAAVGGLEDAALLVVAPQHAEGRDVNGVRVVRMQRDPVDALAAGQAHELPAPPAVVGPEDAAADGSRVARIAFPGADPDDVGIGLVDCHRADGGHRLVVEHRGPGQTAVVRNPHATGGGADDDVVWIGLDGVDRADAPANGGRAECPGCQAFEQIGIDGRRGMASGEDASDQ
jgi:hypothetical protein